jgi:hypothetical protein
VLHYIAIDAVVTVKLWQSKWVKKLKSLQEFACATSIVVLSKWNIVTDKNAEVMEREPAKERN